MKKLFQDPDKREMFSNIIIFVVFFLILGIALYSSSYFKNLYRQSPTVEQRPVTTPSDTTQSNGEGEKIPEPSPTSVPETNVPSQTQKPVSTPDSNSGQSNQNDFSVLPTKNFQSEDELVAYFQNQEVALDSYRMQGEDSSITAKIKNGFITIVDFLFYDKEIGGYRFSELTNKAKLQVIKIALSIDHKIDQYFPGYKDTIKAGYESVKAKAMKLYLDVTASLCSKVGDTTCTQAKADFAKMKDSFGFTFDLMKQAGGNLVDAIRTWYEIFSGKQ